MVSSRLPYDKNCMNNEMLGIIDEIRDRRHFVKPSEKKRMAKKRAIRRWKKQQRKRRN